MRCPYCKEDNSSYRRHCRTCGHDLTQKRTTVRVILLGLLLAVLAIPFFQSCMDRMDRPPEPPPVSE